MDASKAPMRVRPPKDHERIFKILTGPTHHDPLFHAFTVDEVNSRGQVIFIQDHKPVLQRRSSTKMEKNVAPLVCTIP